MAVFRLLPVENEWGVLNAQRVNLDRQHRLTHRDCFTMYFSASLPVAHLRQGTTGHLRRGAFPTSFPSTLLPSDCISIQTPRIKRSHCDKYKRTVGISPSDDFNDVGGSACYWPMSLLTNVTHQHTYTDIHVFRTSHLFSQRTTISHIRLHYFSTSLHRSLLL